MIKYFFPLVFFIVFGTALTGCEQEGPAERAGEKLDNAVEEVGDSLDRSGPAEELGEKVDNAVERTGEELEKAGDKIREKTEN